MTSDRENLTDRIRLATQPTPPDTLRVLVVEDHEDDFVMVKRLLSKSNMGSAQLTWAPNFEEGLAAMTQGDHDIALVDYRLGYRTGLELIDEARDHGWEGPVIMFTGYASDQLDLNAQRAGVAGFFEKDRVDPIILWRWLRYAVEWFGRTRQSMELAHQDPLTGLLNRRGLDAAMRRMDNQARRAEQPIGALFLDVVGMKSINDNHGHEAGDVALCLLAEVLRNSFRASDAVARVGGDEFVVLLMGAEGRTLEGLSRRVRDQLARCQSQFETSRCLTVTIGTASRAAGENLTLEELVRIADANLFARRAKHPA